MNFQITDSELEGGAQLVELGGEVDLYTAPQLKERIAAAIDAGKTTLVIDLTKVTFIDSTTLGVLVAAIKRVRPEGGGVGVVCSEPSITRVFEITGLDQMIPIRANAEDALAALAANQSD